MFYSLDPHVESYRLPLVTFEPALKWPVDEPHIADIAMENGPFLDEL
jgi:hypothetical protein